MEIDFTQQKILDPTLVLCWGTLEWKTLNITSKLKYFIPPVHFLQSIQDTMQSFQKNGKVLLNQWIIMQLFPFFSFSSFCLFFSILCIQGSGTYIILQDSEDTWWRMDTFHLKEDKDFTLIIIKQSSNFVRLVI